jgi:hypothetical protein
LQVFIVNDLQNQRHCLLCWHVPQLRQGQHPIRWSWAAQPLGNLL